VAAALGIEACPSCGVQELAYKGGFWRCGRCGETGDSFRLVLWAVLGREYWRDSGEFRLVRDRVVEVLDALRGPQRRHEGD
jgi:hypothetical protein